MSIEPSKHGVPIDVDPVPDFVESIHAIWQRVVSARVQFAKEIGKAEQTLAITFPKEESWQNRIETYVEVEDAKLEKVSWILLHLLIEKAQELFTKSSVLLKIELAPYEEMIDKAFFTRDAESSPHVKHQRIEAVHPENVDFREIWRQVEIDFSGDKSQKKTYQEAARFIVDASFRGDQGKEAWVEKRMKRQKNQTVLSYPIQVEKDFSGTDYRLSHYCTERVRDFLLRGIKVLSDFLDEDSAGWLQTMCDSLARRLWNSSEAFELGDSHRGKSEKYSWEIVIRKHKLELKMDHEFADLLLKFLDEHYFHIHKAEEIHA